MASFTSRIAGWTAGRLKGEKARKRTMDWMQKTGLGQLLGVAGDAALIGGAMKGAGALGRLITGGAGQTAGTAAALPSTPIESARGMLAGGDGELVSQALESGRAMAPPLKPTMPPMGGATTTMAPRVAGTIRPPATPATMPTVTQPSAMQKMLATATSPRETAKALGRGAMATGRFAKENVEPLAYGASALTDYFANRRRADLEEQQMQLEQERRNRLAELLMPMFQAEVQRYGSSTRG